MRRSLSFALSALMGLALFTPPATASPVVAAPPIGTGFAPVTPTRVLDTRTANTPVGPQGTITLDLSAHVPATATAVVFNLTGTQPTAHTWITVYPSGTKRPNASNLNLMPGENRPNLVTVAVDSSRKVVLYNESGTVHLIADLSGYYAPEAPGKYNLADVIGDPFEGELIGPDSTVTKGFAIPPSATAVTFFLSGEKATETTYVTAWPNGAPRPGTSNLNLVAGQTLTNQVTIPVGADKKVALYNASGDVRLRVHLAGFYTPEFGATFTVQPPSRVLDTRENSRPLQPGEERVVDLSGTLPPSAIATVLTVTGTQPSANTDIIVWSRLGGTLPINTANLHLAAGQTAPLALSVGVGSRLARIHNAAGTVHVVADLTGYFSIPPATPCVHKCVYAWGRNTSGTGFAEVRLSEPRQIYGLSDVAAVADGIALRSDGKLWSWGGGGNGWSPGSSMVPLPVVGLDDVIAINRGIALRRDGTVWAWGSVPGFEGHTPRRVPQLSNIVAVAADDQVAFTVRDDGTVWSWGFNRYGALGINAPEGIFVSDPTQIPNLTGVRSVAAGRFGGLALKNDGTVWSWGANYSGQLGNGTVGRDCFGLPPTGPNCYSPVPVQVTDIAGAIAVTNGSVRGFAVLSDGSARGWGENSLGALGNGQDCQDCQTGTPTEVLGLNCVRDLKAGAGSGFALDCNGHVWSWGTNALTGEPPMYSTIAQRLAKPTGVTAIASELALVP